MTVDDRRDVTHEVVAKQPEAMGGIWQGIQISDDDIAAVRQAMRVGFGETAQRSSLLPKRTEKFAAIMREDGVSLDDLLQGLEQERDEIWRERYADQMRLRP